jgi:Rap1a immunity proteins
MLIAGFVACTASANQITIGDLQEICTARDDGSKNACSFYILGVTEGASTAAALVGDRTHFCIPEGLSSVAMEFTVKKAIGEDLMVYPADRSLAAVGFVAAAMQRAYPCRRSN